MNRGCHFGIGGLTADAAHGALGLDEARLANVMAGFFLEDDGLEKGADGVIGGAVAQQDAKVVFDGAEKAGADFAVGCQSNTIAVAAKRFGDGSDDADLGGAAVEDPAFGGFGRVRGGHRLKGELILEAAQDFSAADDQVLVPDAAGIQGHEFNEAQAQLVVAGETSQRDYLVVVEAANDDGVDLDGLQTDFLGQSNGVQDGGQAVAAGDFLEIGAVQGIEAEADAAQAGIAQGPGPQREKKTVGGQGEIAEAGEGRDFLDEGGKLGLEERFAAGEAHFFNAHSDGDADGALNFVEGEGRGLDVPTGQWMSGGRRRHGDSLSPVDRLGNRIYPDHHP